MQIIDTSTQPQTTSQCKVLLAGDVREERRGLARILRRQGFDVIEFPEWRQLVESVKEAPLYGFRGDAEDVIVVDLRSSGAKGMALIDDAAAAGPIVLITAPGGAPSFESRAQNDWVVVEEPLDVELLRKAVVGVSRLRC